MPKYKCLNEKCSLYNKIVGRNSRSKYDKIKKEWIDTGAICPECGEEGELQWGGEYSTNLINRP